MMKRIIPPKKRNTLERSQLESSMSKTVYRRNTGAHFTFSITECLKNVPVFGSKSVFIISIDNKKDTTSNNNSNRANPILMDMSSEVRLPDHNFAIAANYKFTPSVQ